MSSNKITRKGCGAFFFWLIILGVALTNGWKGIASFAIGIGACGVALPLLFLANNWIEKGGKFTALGFLLWLVGVGICLGAIGFIIEWNHITRF